MEVAEETAIRENRARCVRLLRRDKRLEIIGACPGPKVDLAGSTCSCDGYLGYLIGLESDEEATADADIYKTLVTRAIRKQIGEVWRKSRLQQWRPIRAIPALSPFTVMSDVMSQQIKKISFVC